MPVTRIIVKKDGSIIIEGIGYTGTACLQDLEKILSTLKAFGIEARIEMQQLKPEAQVQETTTRKRLVLEV